MLTCIKFFVGALGSAMILPCFFFVIKTGSTSCRWSDVL